MHSEIAERVRERAYHIWEQEGRPHGRDVEHWRRAEAELTIVPAALRETATAKASKVRRPRR